MVSCETNEVIMYYCILMCNTIPLLCNTITLHVIRVSYSGCLNDCTARQANWTHLPYFLVKNFVPLNH